MLELQRGGLLALALEQETVATARVFKGGGPWFKNYIWIFNGITIYQPTNSKIKQEHLKIQSYA